MPQWFPFSVLISVAAHGGPLTFEAARAAARTKAPDVLLAQQRVAIAQTEVDVAGALMNPTLSVSTATQTARLGTSIGVPLAVFGQRGTAMSAAQADAEVVSLEAELVRRETLWGVTHAWVELWEAQEHARLLETAAHDAERLASVASDKFGAGRGPRVDVVRTKADLARSKAEAHAAAQLTQAASARLAVWIGADPTENPSADGAPTYPPALGELAALESRLVRHPVLARDDRQIAAADQHIVAERRARWPTLTPQLSVNQLDPSLPGADFIFGLAFDLPVLSQRGGAISRALAQRALAEQASTADRLRLRAALRDAHERATAARETLRALREDVVPALEEARQLTEEGYQSGYFDLIRLIDARRTALETRLAEVDALASWARAVADLERAVGDDMTEAPHAP